MATYNPNPLPSTLSITPHPTKGRALTATQSFAPGALINLFADPLLVIPAGKSTKTICNQCLAPRLPARACTGCGAVAYCSSKCQSTHWKAIHKLECKLFKRVKKSVGWDWLPTPVRGLAQWLLLLAEEAKGTASGEKGELRKVIDGLEGNVKGFKKHKVWGDIELQALAGCKYAGWEESEENLILAREILCKIQTNTFDRSDPDLGTDGIFLDPVLAMANHSCIPKAEVVFAGRRGYLRATEPIKKGEEITISYLGYTKPKAVRQRGLELYHFECDCPRCTDDLDVYQVCAASPCLPLNSLSFALDPAQLRKPDIDTTLARSASFRKNLPVIYDACHPEATKSPEERLTYLRDAWKQCAPLINARTWAIEPFSHICHQAVAYYREQGENLKALVVACFIITRQDPYLHAAPFKTWRLKNLLLIVNIMTAVEPPGSSIDKVDPRIVKVLEQMDEASIFQAVLLLVMHYAPMGHSEEWDVLSVAKVMIKDLEALEEGRAKDSELLKMWIKDPENPQMAQMFREGVVEKVKMLGDLAIPIMKADFEA